jgi:ribosomal protein L7/L12
MTIDRETMRRLARLEFLVDNLYKRSGVEMPGADAGHSADSDLSPGVQELIASGDAIQAIKQYRAETGAGLAEAKAALGLGAVG